MSGWHTKGKLRPQVWKTGPDPVLHEMYHCWQVQKAQCKFRDEEFNLTFEEYSKFWKKDWAKRGRTPDAICMTRIDWDGAWEIGNVELLSRAEHFKRQGQFRMQRMMENRPYKKSGPKPKSNVVKKVVK